MPDKEFHDIEQMRKIAKWFYRGDGVKKRLSMPEIARRLGIDKRTAEKRLDRALEEGIVRIEIPETVECGEEHELKLKFGLREIIVVPSPQAPYSELLSLWGVEAARYFEKVTERGQHNVGISGGETLLNFCECLGTRRRDNVHIHTTALIGRGELAPTASHVDPNVNATLLWSKCGRVSGHCHYATVPPYDNGWTREKITEELQKLTARKPILDVIKRMDEITIAFAGLGLVKPKAGPREFNQLTMTGLLEPVISTDILAEEGAFADLAYNLLDRDGNTRKEWAFFLTAGHCDDDPTRHGLGFFRQMVLDGKTVVVIAGFRKVKAICAALKARAFNVWITDRKSLLDVHDEIMKESEPAPS